MPTGLPWASSKDPYAGWVLVVVDAQWGFDDTASGARNDPACDDNIAALVDAWSRRDRRLVRQASSCAATRPTTARPID